MGLLTQNSKMKKSSQNGITVVNWTIPAFQDSKGFKTCPNAGACAAGCYARSGTYRFSGSIKAHEAKLKLSQSDTFVIEMIKEIYTWLEKKSVKTLKVRIHDAGDFYSVEYLDKWTKIMNHFSGSNRVSFYAYTKQVQLFKSSLGLPSNFRAVFSYGGKQDSMIDVNKDFHSRVFESIEALNAAGYTDGTQDDMIASDGLNKKIGLVYHGAKNYSNTSWNKAA